MTQLLVIEKLFNIIPINNTSKLFLDMLLEIKYDILRTINTHPFK